jgi:hypothetical protein
VLDVTHAFPGPAVQKFGAGTDFEPQFVTHDNARLFRRHGAVEGKGGRVLYLHISVLELALVPVDHAVRGSLPQKMRKKLRWARSDS